MLETGAGGTPPEIAVEAPPAPALGPVNPGERIAVIDVLRGLALFGIIAANMRGFAAPAMVYFNPKLLWTGVPDRIAQALIEILVQGKFITIFAFLFGLGFAVQLARSQERGAKFGGLFSRRLLALLLIGLAHEALLWWGDILVPYAIGGFFLLLFRKRKDKTVMVWCQILYWLPMVFAAGFVLAIQFGAPIPSIAPDPAKLKKTIDAYQQGAWMQIFWARLEELKPQFAMMPMFLPRVIGLFLLGVWVWRKGIFQNAADRLDDFRRWMKWGFAVGLPGNLIAYALGEISGMDMARPNPVALVVWLLQSAAVPALSLAYGSLAILLFHSEAWKARLQPFGAVGRTALTNYLLQSLICTTIFYSYGFRLYGLVGPAMLLIPTLLVYAAQVPLSQWWLERRRYGPVEWVWRRMTYGTLS